MAKAGGASQPYRRMLFDEAVPLDEEVVEDVVVNQRRFAPQSLPPPAAPWRPLPQAGPELGEEIPASPRRPPAPLAPLASVPRSPPRQFGSELVEEPAVNVPRSLPESASAGPFLPCRRQQIAIEDLPEPVAEFVRRRLAPAGKAATKYFTLQHYRGSSAGLADLVLSDGEFWIATDTATLYVGLAGTIYQLCVGTAT